MLYNLFVGQIQAQYTFDLFGATRLANAALAARVNVQAYQLEAARRALAANIVTGGDRWRPRCARRSIRPNGSSSLANDEARDTQRRYELGSASRT